MIDEFFEEISDDEPTRAEQEMTDYARLVRHGKSLKPRGRFLNASNKAIPQT